MREVNPLLKSILNDHRSAMEFRELQSVFDFFHHELRFVHKVDDVNFSSLSRNNQHHFRPRMPDFCWRPRYA